MAVIGGTTSPGVAEKKCRLVGAYIKTSMSVWNACYVSVYV